MAVGEDERANAAAFETPWMVVPVMDNVRFETPDSTSITSCTMAGASLVRVVGDIDGDVAGSLRAALDAATAEHTWIIVDMARTRIIDSVGLSVLVTAGLCARRQGGDLFIAAPSSFVRSILHCARPATTFAVHDTVSQALTAAHARQRARPGRAVVVRQRDSASR